METEKLNKIDLKLKTRFAELSGSDEARLISYDLVKALHRSGKVNAESVNYIYRKVLEHFAVNISERRIIEYIPCSVDFKYICKGLQSCKIDCFDDLLVGLSEERAKEIIDSTDRVFLSLSYEDVMVSMLFIVKMAYDFVPKEDMLNKFTLV